MSRTRKFKEYYEHNVFVETPHPRSLASLIKLSKYYARRDDSSYIRWLDFRKKFFKNYQRKHKTMVCNYCGKKNLITHQGGNQKHPHNSATLDHAYPLARGGRKFDPNNIRIACRTCNQAKGDMGEWEFRNHIVKKAIRKLQYAIKVYFRGFINLTSLKEFVIFVLKLK